MNAPPHILAYVATLGDLSRGWFREAYERTRDFDDTLDEEWQIAAAILDIFDKRAAAWQGRQ